MSEWIRRYRDWQERKVLEKMRALSMEDARWRVRWARRYFVGVVVGCLVYCAGVVIFFWIVLWPVLVGLNYAPVLIGLITHVVVLIGLGVPVETRSALRLMQRYVDGRCIRCGYDLRESSDRCPECGREIDWLPERRSADHSG